MDISEHSTSYKVRIADAGADGYLKLPALLQMLQEIATEHAEILGVDFRALKPKGLGWALSKIAIDIDKLPQWGSRVAIKTWASDRERIVTYREFVATSNDGEKLFTARSQWLLFDFNTRRLSRMDALGEFSHIAGKYANEYDFSERLAAPSAQTDNGILRDAGVCDIDLNGHVNNAVYMAWALDAVAVNPNAVARRARINFLEEVRPHAKIISLCEKLGDTTVHSIRSQESGRECARVNIDWQSQ